MDECSPWLQVCVVRFTKSQLKVMSTGFDRALGGRAFDQVMFDHFVEEFKVGLYSR